MKTAPISSAMEDYLKALFELGETGIKTQQLADELNLSAASVTNMLKKLAALKLVEHEKYYGSSLTPAGRLIALETLRHHRLIETYLVQALGFEWHEVHDEAEKLEHHISEAFEARIAAALGNPSTDPHGDPIPQLDGSLPELQGQPLTSFEVGSQLELLRFKRQEPDVLKYLAEHDLKPGQIIELTHVAPFGGPLTLSIRDGSPTISLAHELASTIHAVLSTKFTEKVA